MTITLQKTKMTAPDSFAEPPQETPPPDYGQLLRRLEMLKNAVLLADPDDLALQTRKLTQLAAPDMLAAEIAALSAHLAAQRYHDAMTLIDELLNKFRAVAIYRDPKIDALRAEIYVLGRKISDAEAELDDLKKQLAEFQLRYNQELGELIREILRRRKEIAEQAARENPDPQKQQKAEEAANDYERFDRAYARDKDRKLRVLDAETQAEMKKIFRQASHLCHPDKVSDAQKSAAEKCFLRLQDAYENNDFETVTEIYEQLQRGEFHFNDKAAAINEEAQLLAAAAELRGKLQQLEKELAALKTDATYQALCEIKDLDAYFAGQRERLAKELAEIKEQTAKPR